MNKALKIGGLILGAIIAAALVIFIFFPGLPTYAYVKFKYKSIDKTIGKFETQEVLPDYTDFTINGITFKASSSFSAPNEYSSAIKSENGSIMVMESKTEDLKAVSEITGEDYSMWSGAKYSEEDYKSYFKAVGAPYPDEEEGNAEVLWYYRTTLKAKDCLKLRGRDLKVFREFAANKEESLEMEDSWTLDVDGAEAFVGHIKTIEGGGESADLSYIWTVTIYPDGAKGRHYVMILSKVSEDAIRKIAGTIKLA